MVESKIFYGTVEQGNDVNPPFVPVQAVDVWHLEAVPVPTAPSYLHDEQEAEPVVPSIVVATTGEERTERPSQSIMLDDEKDPEKKLQMGAGVASGVIGLLLGGPFLGLLLGFAAAYATQRNDAWGDSARALGHVALTAQEQAHVVNEKHNLVERSRRVAQQTLRRAHDLDRKYNIRTKTIEVVHMAWEITCEFVTKHKLIQRSLDGTNTAIMWIMEQLEKKIQESQQRREQESLQSNTRQH